MNVKQQTRELWKTCFGDPDEWIEMYFRRRYADDINKYIEMDGNVVSALQVIPYTMTFGAGQEVPVGYISGACTRPDCRGRGLMRRLLREVHREMYDQGVWLSTLIPAEEWLKGYYERSGYATCFHYEELHFAADSNLLPAAQTLTARATSMDDEAYSLFGKCMKMRPCCIQHSRDDLETVMEDIRMAGGGLYGIYNKGILSGLAFCLSPSGGVLQVRELLLDDGVGVEAALRALCWEAGVAEAVCILPPEFAPRELGMARVIRVEDALGRYAQLHPSEEMCIEVMGDDAIEENCGFWLVSGGRCRRVAASVSAVRVMAVSALTRMLLEDLRPYMSLMMN